MSTESMLIKQHLIDPEICIRCNTCEATCPVGAITHDARNYVVDPAKCEFCLACIPPCPTGAIDQWRKVLRIKAYTVAEQFAWDALPAEQSAAELAQAAAAAGVSADVADVPAAAPGSASAAAQAGVAGEAAQFHAAQYGATVPPWSAAHPYTQLYGPKAAQKSVTATVVGNVRVTDVGTDYDTHHVMLDFGSMPFPVLEGQSIGVIPPGTDEQGRPHHARQYSIASPRNGERAGYNNLSLAVKRVLGVQVVAVQRSRRKILQVERHDGFSAAVNGRRHHVPIIGVGQFDGWNQVLEAFDQAVAHTRIHQGARFFQSSRIEFGTLLEQVANPLVVDGI